MLTEDVRARREKVVLDHFHDEVEQDWDAVLLGGINLRSPKGLLTMARVLRGFAKLSREPKGVIPDTPARNA